ncbi:MAG: hypothetical protein D6750_03565 [Bacteroidetes bacterium]|nr:MAG: hypothetical protein D6750_03565 [Bacteroidota bacterium]
MKARWLAVGGSSLFFWVSCCPTQVKVDYLPGEEWSYALPITVRGPYAANTKAFGVSMFVDGEHRDGFLIWGDARGETYKPFTFHAPAVIDYQPSAEGSYALPITIKGPYAANTKAVAVSAVDSAGNVTERFLIWGDGRGEAFRPFTFHAPVTVQEIYAKGRPLKWPDYVFSPDYRLLPLSELEAYVRTYRHLPGLPPAEKVAQEGVPLTETHLALVRKVEELTLYVIALQKQVDSLRAQLQASPCK